MASGNLYKFVQSFSEVSCRAEIWGAGEWKEVEKLQREMGRRILR